MAVKLNKEQKEAVTHGTGPLLIIAGAGTGKTTVVTERISYLIKKELAKPTEILALTFTEKASREMEERVDAVLPYGYTQMWISTFHSFGDRILRDEALQIGYNPRFKLMSTAENIQFLRKNFFEFNLNYFRPLGNPNKFLEGILQHFARLQDENISPKDYLDWVKKQGTINKNSKDENSNIETEKWQELAGAYRKYEELKVKEGRMDYGDLIVKTLELFNRRPNVLQNYKEKFKYILVDEFQDTNIAQNDLVMLLAGKNGNITVVADDDQSIYKWRGAAVSNVIQFRDNYPKAKLVTLTKNYRSTQEILDKSYDLIQHNNPDRLEVKESIDKRLVSQVGKKSEIALIHENRVENEAQAVANKILSINKEDKIAYGEIAVLVRANNHADAFVRAFARAGIQYQFLGPGKLFRASEILELISYLKVLYDFDDSTSFYRLLSIDYFKIPVKDLIKLSNYAKKLNLSLFEAAEKVEDVKMPAASRKKIKNIIKILKSHIKLIQKDSAGQLLYKFLEDTGLISELLKVEDVNTEKKAANISRFFDKLKTFETENLEAGVVEVVDWIDLAMEVGESPMAADMDWAKVDAVNILTVHSAKGLEFPVVFLVNLVDARFPTRERREQIPIPDALIKEILPTGDAHMQEERRLFYVGMTRAEKKLFLTAADYYGEGKREKKMSPFIYEALGEDTKSIERVVEGEQLSILDYNNISDTKQKPLSHKLKFISYSKINTFKVCPLHYKLNYILGIPFVPSAATSFGTSMHDALKDFYERVMIGNKVDKKTLLTSLEENWMSLGYKSKSHEKKTKGQGIEYLENYFKNQFDKGTKVLAVEKGFVVPLAKDKNSISITGRIDRVDEVDSNTIEIIDYKTGERVPGQREVDRDLQMSFYALAATRVGEAPFNRDIKNVKLSFYYFKEGEKISTNRTAEELEAAIDEIFEWKKKIEESDFSCSGSFICQNCEYQLLCNTD